MMVFLGIIVGALLVIGYFVWQIFRGGSWIK
jgi:hypothetical protein